MKTHQKSITSPVPRTNPLNLLPPEIRSQIFAIHLLSHFETFPQRQEIIYQANGDVQLWNQDWQSNPDICELPSLERALIGDRRLHREFFSLRVSMSVLVIRPAECSDHSIFSRGSDIDALCQKEAAERKKIRFPILGRHISPLVIRSVRAVRYLTYVHNPLLDEICIDKNEVTTELGKSLIDLARWTDSYMPSLRALTIVFRVPFYALYWTNHEYEREVFWSGFEMLVKGRGVHKLRLKRDDGQGWQGNGPDFGVLGEELDKQLGLEGVVMLVDDISNIIYNRATYPYTGVIQTWEGVNGNRLIWKDVDGGINPGEDQTEESIV